MYTNNIDFRFPKEYENYLAGKFEAKIIKKQKWVITINEQIGLYLIRFRKRQFFYIQGKGKIIYSEQVKAWSKMHESGGDYFQIGKLFGIDKDIVKHSVRFFDSNPDSIGVLLL